MRKLIYSINLSIDACCDHTKMTGDDSIMEFFGDLLRESDLLVYGRTTYELMVPYWPDIAKKPMEDPVEYEFAQAFDALDKIVFSKTIKEVGERTRIVRTNLKEEILKLKQEHGGHILTGGIALSSKLVELGLVDEYYFVVQPVIVGGGRRLFEGIHLSENIKLKLVEAKPLKTGHVMLHYVNP